jgi:hypothetical protein
MTGFKNFVEHIHSTSKDIVFGHPGWEGEAYLETEPYYKWLANFVRLHKPHRVLELGRRHGNSLFALSRFLPDTSTLTSYDIKECGNVVSKPNVHIRVYDGDFSKFDFSQYDFIFIDINGGGGKEYEIYQQMKSQGYKGVSAWDDVNSKWCLPELMWNKVTDVKVLTNFNNSGSGFGFILL